jgi:hypothetical protein
MFVVAAGSVGYYSDMSGNVRHLLSSRSGRRPTPVRYGALHISTPHDSLHEATGIPLLTIASQVTDCAAVSSLWSSSHRSSIRVARAVTHLFLGTATIRPPHHLQANLLLGTRKKITDILYATLEPWPSDCSAKSLCELVRGLPLLNSPCRPLDALKELTMYRTNRTSLGPPHRLLPSPICSVPPTHFNLPYPSEPQANRASRGPSPHRAANQPPPWRGNQRKSPCGSWRSA